MSTFVFEGVILRESRGYSALCLDVDVATSARTPALARSRLPVIVSPEDVVERFPIRVGLSVSARA